MRAFSGAFLENDQQKPIFSTKKNKSFSAGQRLWAFIFHWNVVVGAELVISAQLSCDCLDPRVESLKTFYSSKDLISGSTCGDFPLCHSLSREGLSGLSDNPQVMSEPFRLIKPLLVS